MEKSKELEIQLVENNNVNRPAKLECELKELNELQIVNKNTHEVKQEVLQDFGNEFEMIGKLSVGHQIRETCSRFRSITGYEHYIYSIDEDYDAEDAVFNGYIYKTNTIQFTLNNRSEYENGRKHEIIKYHGNNCFIPTKGPCFVNFTN